MAQVAWLVSEVHSADRKDEDDRADPDPNGGLFFGIHGHQFHDRITAM
jgi:hypothetical protein